MNDPEEADETPEPRLTDEPETEVMIDFVFATWSMRLDESCE